MHTHRLLTRIALLLITASPLLGCGGDDLDVLIEGQLIYPECGEMLPWEPVFATYTEDPYGAGLIRFQSQPGPLQEQDAMVIVLPDASLVRASTGVALPVLYDQDDAIHASFDFRSACPTSSFATVASGWIRFDAFSGDYDTKAVGEFELSVYNARTLEELTTNVHGSFDFPIERYRPYQSFN